MHRLYQFTLDLFGVAPATVPPAPPAPPVAAAPLKRPLQTLVPGSTQAPTSAPVVAPTASRIPLTRPSLPPQPLTKPLPQNLPKTLTLTQSLAPASFVHPRATRSICLAGITIGFEFKRGKRLTIGFSVGPDGLAVRAPKWVPLLDVDQAVQDKAGWIIKKLEESQARHQRLESSRIEWKNGATLPYLGQQITLVLDPSHAFSEPGAALKKSVPCAEISGFGPETPAAGSRQTLYIGLPQSADAAQIRDAVQAWLMRQAKRLFVQRLNHFAPTLKVEWRKLSLSNAGTRWGSASADGSLRLNWRLIHFSPAVIDYVVVHELSHLRVMDHSPLFWATVGSIVPDYALLRGQLKAEGMPAW